MHLQTQSLSPRLSSLPHHLPPPKPTSRTHFPSSKQKPHRQFPLRCSVSTLSNPETTRARVTNDKPFPAEVSRTIIELSSVGTLSTLAQEEWPLGIGVRFAVGEDGTPILCLGESFRPGSVDTRSSLHVKLEQCGMRTPQCTIQGSLSRPDDVQDLKAAELMNAMFLAEFASTCYLDEPFRVQLLRAAWKKRFGEEANEDLMYVVRVERVLQMDDFMEDGVWVSSSDFKTASADPLRDSAESIVNEINAKNMEDVYRFCNVFVDLDFQVSKAKVIWVDKLGFDMRLSCPEQGASFDVRIPFPREVTDEKGAKSSFNCMSQLAWEVEKNFQVPNFEKVKQLKRVSFGVL